MLDQRKLLAGRLEELLLEAHPLSKALTLMPGVGVKTGARILDRGRRRQHLAGRRPQPPDPGGCEGNDSIGLDIEAADRKIANTSGVSQPFSATSSRTTWQPSTEASGTRTSGIDPVNSGSPKRFTSSHSGPFPDQPQHESLTKHRFPRSARVHLLYHQQTKNLLVSYSPKKLGFF
ncbi:hypothetical protein ABZZ47_05070 [Streptomyces sp. NPDC006465]|uniref:hypothetical protein n=1 Tax=Streptomyces sp. NPDC006465 TaxID=3157174 RepID=UPI0033B74E46